ncbi:MAG: cytochrome P450 [Alphaproteobacteria bacterium]
MSASYPHVPRSSLLEGHVQGMRTDTYRFFLRSHRKHGDALRLNGYNLLDFYSFTHPDALQQILITDAETYSHGARWENIIAMVGGDALIVKRGQDWQDRRQILLPYFQARRIDTYVDSFVQTTRDYLRRHAAQGDHTVNISRIMTHLTLVNISKALFAYNMGDEDIDQIGQAISACFDTAGRHIANPLSLPTWVPTPANLAFRRQLAVVDGLAARIIAHHQSGQHDSMLSGMMKADDFTTQELRDELVTMLLAGHDTTATGLAWIWHLLADRPEVVGQIRDEMRSVLKGDLPDMTNIRELEYTALVINEALRLYPPVWGLSRYAEASGEITGHDVPRGSQMVLPFYVTHRDARWWGRPDDFNPDHFTQQAIANRPRHAYMPFGAGQRVCLGLQIAWVEIIVILTTMLKYAIPDPVTPQSEIKPKILFNIRPETDIVMSFQQDRL